MPINGIPSYMTGVRPIRTGAWRTHVLLAVLFSTFVICLPIPGGADQGSEPAEVVSRLNQTLLQTMRNAEALGFQGRYNLLEPVIKDSFALPFMLRTTLGRHWDAVRPEQRDRLLDLYTRWSVATYASRFDGYSGQHFEIQGEDSSGRWLLVDSVLHSGGDTVLFRYVFPQDNGARKILDIQIKGASQLATHRSQMSAIVNRDGLDGLEHSLRERIETLSRGNEEPASSDKPLTDLPASF